jgi:hypothetical protein
MPVQTGWHVGAVHSGVKTIPVLKDIMLEDSAQRQHTIAAKKLMNRLLRQGTATSDSKLSLFGFPLSFSSEKV